MLFYIVEIVVYRKGLEPLRSNISSVAGIEPLAPLPFVFRRVLLTCNMRLLFRHLYIKPDIVETDTGTHLKWELFLWKTTIAKSSRANDCLPPHPYPSSIGEGEEKPHGMLLHYLIRPPAAFSQGRREMVVGQYFKRTFLKYRRCRNSTGDLFT